MTPEQIKFRVKLLYKVISDLSEDYEFFSKKILKKEFFYDDEMPLAEEYLKEIWRNNGR
jgi:hypothetical protein